MAKMAEEVSGLVFAGRSAEMNLELLTIAESATENALANRKPGQFLAGVPYSEVAFLVL